MLIVLDTNVFISALMTHGGHSDQLLDLWQEKYFDLITSSFQRDELSRALSYKKIKSYVSEQEVSRLHLLLSDFALVVDPTPDISFSADADDNVILGTAIAGKADILVSGGKKHLLPLVKIQDIPILAPRDAIKRILLKVT